MFAIILYLLALVVIAIGVKYTLDYIDQHIDPELVELKKATENISIKAENEAVKPEIFNKQSDAPKLESPKGKKRKNQKIIIEQEDEGKSIGELFIWFLPVGLGLIMIASIIYYGTYENNKSSIYQKKRYSAQQTPWWLRIDSLEMNNNSKEFLGETATVFLGFPELLHYQISAYDIQNYLEHNVPELMQTKAGRNRIISDGRKLASIPAMQRAGQSSQVNKVIHEFRSSIKRYSNSTLR